MGRMIRRTTGEQDFTESQNLVLSSVSDYIRKTPSRMGIFQPDQEKREEPELGPKRRIPQNTRDPFEAATEERRRQLNENLSVGGVDLGFQPSQIPTTGQNAFRPLTTIGGQNVYGPSGLINRRT